MAGLGGPEVLILIIVLLVLFGGSRIPKLARHLGETRRELNQAFGESDDDRTA